MLKLCFPIVHGGQFAQSAEAQNADQLQWLDALEVERPASHLLISLNWMDQKHRGTLQTIPNLSPPNATDLWVNAKHKIYISGGRPRLIIDALWKCSTLKPNPEHRLKSETDLHK